MSIRTVKMGVNVLCFINQVNATGNKKQCQVDDTNIFIYFLDEFVKNVLIL
jgi:hypothetical protein